MASRSLWYAPSIPPRTPRPSPSRPANKTQQNHVHLISGHRFPMVPSLNLEEAFRYLIDTPQIVKALAPMAWTYVQAPQDGTLWLEWLPPNRNDNRFPSDGYVWADAEQTYRQEYGGYTIEIMQHTVGYRPHVEHMAAHSRTRYHFIAKNPSVPAAPPDPLLWLVHYHQAEQQRILPAQQVPPNQQMSQILNERRWLESQGRLEKKDFMLHDRDHWPRLNVPTAGNPAQQGQQPMYGAHPMGPGAHMRQPSFPQAYPQQPPNKKQRQQPPSVAPGPPEGVLDTSIEDEENTTLGDYFDHLTPRDISVARYTQHHRWMEEVFSSPYASNQIVPADLGLGLMGELRGLTEGILEPPSLDSLDGPQGRPQKPAEAQPFTNLKKEQLEEFNKRVEKHLEDGQAEIARMKADHAAKMQEWKKTKILTQAEKRLRNATWAGHENAVPVYRLEETLTNGHAGATKETVEDVLKDVEGQLGIKIASHKEANMVAEGGLEEEPERPEPEPMDEGLDEQIMEQPQPDSRTASEPQPSTYQQDSTTALQTSAQTQPPTLGQPVAPQAQQSPATNMSGGQGLVDGSDDNMLSMDLNDDAMMGDVDLDMDTGDLEFDTNGLDDIDDPSVSLEPSAPTSNQTPSAPNANAGTPSTATMPASTPLETAQSLAQPAPSQPSAAPAQSESTDMFPDTTFDDLTGGDDGLIDFEGGMGMDDSAFGDALHGMEGADDDDAAAGGS